jgi:predicted nucleic acid-binding protein
MTKIVVDASVALKWIFEEAGTSEALVLLKQVALAAPDLLIAECANAIWKKVRRGELGRDEALIAARVLGAAEIELLPTRSLIEQAVRLAIELNHPAYDCVYLALATANHWRFVTADEGIGRKARQLRSSRFRDAIVHLSEAPVRLGLNKSGDN